MIAVTIVGFSERRKTRLRMSSREVLELQAELGRSFIASISCGEEGVDLCLEGRFERFAEFLPYFLIRVGAEGTIKERRKLPECSRIKFGEDIVVLGVKVGDFSDAEISNAMRNQARGSALSKTGSLSKAPYTRAESCRGAGAER